MTIAITTHASSHNLTHHASSTANRRSTKANDEDNGGIPETSLHQRNDHQGTWRKVDEVVVPGKVISSPTDTNLEEAKASHLANDRRHRVLSRETASYVAKQATVHLTVCSVASFKLCFHNRSNLLRITTLSRETECWATHYWL